MVQLTRRQLAASALGVFGATAVAVSTASSDRTLVVADADSRDRLLEIAVDDGDEITIAYTHSVQKTPVEDVYVADRSTLRADRSVFHSFGAGLPTENVERTEEGYVVQGSGTYDELFVVPGAIAGHELVVDDERYDLVEVADGSVVLFLTDRSVGDALANRREALRADGSIELIRASGSIETQTRTATGGATDSNV